MTSYKIYTLDPISKDKSVNCSSLVHLVLHLTRKNQDPFFIQHLLSMIGKHKAIEYCARRLNMKGTTQTFLIDTAVAG